LAFGEEATELYDEDTPPRSGEEHQGGGREERRLAIEEHEDIVVVVLLYALSSSFRMMVSMLTCLVFGQGRAAAGLVCRRHTQRYYCLVAIDVLSGHVRPEATAGAMLDLA
jgi:hypothetical protein